MDAANDALERLLSESVDAAKERARTAFDRIAEGRPIVLFGAGGLGKHVAEALAKEGVTPLAFADGNASRNGTTFAGLPVVSTPEAIARWGHDAVFVVTVWRNPASELMSDRIRMLEEAGADRVTSFVTLAWKYPAALLPYYSMDLPELGLGDKDAIREAFALLRDERSRAEFVAHLGLRFEVDFAHLLPPVAEPQYFPTDIFQLQKDERFVDIGAYDGDSLRSLLRAIPGFHGAVAAFEPDTTNFAKLERWTTSAGLDARLFRAGVGAKSEQVSFGDGGGTGSAIGAGTTTIDVVALDDVIADFRPTFLKADVEGYEPEVLDGAARLIRQDAPILALSSYHRQDHLWRLPLMVKALRPDYRFWLRSYYLDGWELVLYAVPPSRVTSP